MNVAPILQRSQKWQLRAELGDLSSVMKNLGTRGWCGDNLDMRRSLQVSDMNQSRIHVYVVWKSEVSHTFRCLLRKSEYVQFRKPQNTRLGNRLLRNYY
jgi:hypothetical protein